MRPFGGPYNKDYSTLGSLLGSAHFGKLPSLQTSTFQPDLLRCYGAQGYGVRVEGLITFWGLGLGVSGFILQGVSSYPSPNLSWVAVKELKLSYCTGKPY